MTASGLAQVYAIIRVSFFFERVSLPVTAFPARFTSLELVVVRTFACIVAHTARSSKIRCDCCSLHYESSSYAARYTASLGEFSSYAVQLKRADTL